MRRSSAFTSARVNKPLALLIKVFPETAAGEEEEPLPARGGLPFEERALFNRSMRRTLAVTIKN
jgi:hypothetical protein